MTLFKEVIKETTPKTTPKTSGEQVETGQSFSLFGMIGSALIVLLLIGGVGYFIKNKKIL